MSEILLYYRRPDPTTWVYLSSFLTIGLFFVFHRFWSIRNLDLLLLIVLAPGLLIVQEGYRRQLVESEALAQQERTAEDADLDPAQAESDSGPTESPTSDSSNDAGPDILTSDESGIPPPSDVASDETSVSSESPPTPETSSPEAPQADISPGADPVARVNQTSRFPAVRRLGFVYLFVVEALLLIRLMLDPLMVRRPLLDPNLTSGGLTFIGIAMFVFLMANVVTSDSRIQVEQGPALGPGYALMNMLPAIPTRPLSDSANNADSANSPQLSDSELRLARIAKTLAITAQLSIIIGIVLVGNRHFGNLRAGVGCATLYLMLPYTAQMTGRVDHAVPAALLLWAVLCYRRPLIAGVFMGLAAGLVYYPFFLLPLWVSFYWQRGVRLFAIGVVAMLGLLVALLLADQSASLGEHLQRMFGLFSLNKSADELRGFWSLGVDTIWRLPVIVAFVILCGFFAVWPAQKNLGTLLSSTAAVMVAAQFWHGYGGGRYIAWFLPMLLLTSFRPNLQDRVATKMVMLRGKMRPPSVTTSNPRTAA